MADKAWIQAATKHKGALRETLGIKEGEIIPKGLLNEIANAEIGDTVQGYKVTDQLHKQVILAKTLAKMKK